MTVRVHVHVKCDLCGQIRDVEPTDADRSLAIAVIDHRSKFSGSSVLAEWYGRFGDYTPEQVFPDLVGFDVDAYYEGLRILRDGT